MYGSEKLQQFQAYSEDHELIQDPTQKSKVHAPGPNSNHKKQQHEKPQTAQHPPKTGKTEKKTERRKGEQQHEFVY